MLDYIRNRNDIFRTKKVHSASPEEIEAEIKKAFKYTNLTLRQDYMLLKQLRKL